MEEKIKNVLAIILLVLLLPYVITMLMSGKLRQSYETADQLNTYISVEADGKITEISFEDYVMGVAALQISSGYESEALKAQMIVTRTNLELQKEENPDALLDEPYIPVNKLEEMGIKDKLKKASSETDGQVLTYKGKLIMASYHAISAGSTRSGKDVFESSKYPYLVSVKSTWDAQAERFIYVNIHENSSIIKKIKEQYQDMKTKDGKSKLTSQNLWENIKVSEKDKTGYVKSIIIGDKTLPGEEFRKLLGLNSSCFTLEKADGGIRIVTKGLGHGVGFSQFGANHLAKSGKTYEEILKYYYKKVELKTKSVK